LISNILELLNEMEPISLADMDRAELMNRVDTKYVFGERELAHLLASAAAEYRVLTVNEIRIAPYVTLYFDSPDHDCFRQHHNGKLNRAKYRMREYSTSGVCFFEVKQKNNKGRTDKRRMPIVAIEETMSAEAMEFLRSTPAGMAFNGKAQELAPQLWTRFSRITLVHRHQPERVTFDCDLDFHFQTQQQKLSGIVIAEIKQESDDRRSTMRELLRCKRIRPLRVSKYCLGSTLLKPHLKSNCFKAKLRAIRNIA
jgi:hypothetical protein